MFIREIILWPRDTTKGPKEFLFERDKLNIIYGDSRTGKSALIPIVDYCLCSSDCRIPTGTIRQACGWYGIVLQIGNESLLLARRDPGNQSVTTDMYTSRADSLDIPKTIEGANNSSDVVKNELNQLLGITDLQLSDDGSSYNSRPSVRDEAAFVFQPQNIIANPEALFYKLDDFNHRRKLANAFPYFLGALTGRELSIRDELSENKKKIDKLNREIEAISDLSERWLGIIDGELSRAAELGLSSFDLDNKMELGAQIDEIRRISELGALDSFIDSDCLDNASDKLIQLGKRDRDLSAQLSQLQGRRHLIEETIDAYSEHNLTKQSIASYLGTAEWMADKVKNEGICPLCGAPIAGCSDIISDLISMVQSMDEGEEPYSRLSLDKELTEIKKRIRSTLDERASIAQSMRFLSDKIDEDKYRFGEVDRFIGELRASYRQYADLRDNDELIQRRERLLHERKRLEDEYNERGIEEKKASALNAIALFTTEYLESLDVENAEMATRLDISNLTLKIQDDIDSNQYRYLNQMGSASNWLSYHVALSLALQKYFQTVSPVGMPAFIIYDQPSQVYFPHEIDDARDRDKQAVKDLIGLLAHCASSADFPCQIILTEHAGEDIWGGFSEINEVAHWESDGEKLVPSDWVLDDASLQTAMMAVQEVSPGTIDD